MKKYIIFIILLLAVFSCKNQDIEFEDYEYTTGYFPYQYPIRTLILGDYIYDNSNDNNHKFLISAAIGGVYSNREDREFKISVDESLCNRVLFASTKDTIRAMPSNYYTLSADKIVVSSGKVNGSIEVQLNDAFFQDPLAIELGYVVPVRLTSSNDVDSLLSGKTTIPNADPRNNGQWDILPKNFTMFAVKYINEYHGSYLHYGSSKLKNKDGQVVEDITYREEYVEKNPVVKLATSGRYQVSMQVNFKSTSMTGLIKMLLDFNGDNCTITAPADYPYTISGSGKFQHGKYNWGNKERNGIELQYTVSDGEFTYEASDVLVARDRGIVMELFSPLLY